MRITYVDESARRDRFYFLGGLVVDTESLHEIEHDLDEICASVSRAVDGFAPSTELHAYDVYHGKRGWAEVPPGLRANVSVRAVTAIASSGASFFLRGIDVVRLRERYPTPHPAHELALAQLLESIDQWLARSARSRSLVIADEHHTAEESRRRFGAMRLSVTRGYSTRILTQLDDTIYFGPSHHSRLLQAVDVMTFFAGRRSTAAPSDPRSRSATEAIAAQLDMCTVRDYLWP